MTTRSGAMPDTSSARRSAHPQVQRPPREKSQRSGCASTQRTLTSGCRRTCAASVAIAVQWSPPSTVSTESAGTSARRSATWDQPVSMSDPAVRSPMSCTPRPRSEEHTSELQSPYDLVCRLLLEKKKKNYCKTIIKKKKKHKKHQLE